MTVLDCAADVHDSHGVSDVDPHSGALKRVNRRMVMKDV
jgi:hypothetical protein